MERLSNIGGGHLARMLAGFADGDGPLHEQLSNGLSDLIHLGELPGGVRLPSERSLAPALHVSRTTITTAYARLRERGLLESRQGSGTFVVEGAARRRDPMLIGDDRLETFGTGESQGTLDFSSAAMPGLPLVADGLDDAVRDSLRPLLSHHGYYPAGLHDTRVAIAEYLTASGVPTRPEEILVTSGAQQGLRLVTQAFVDAGDRVVVEDPTYRGVITTLRAAGARIRTVPSGPTGADLGALAAAIARDSPRLVYLLPVVHNPTGAVMPEAERRHLAQLSARTGTMLIDDAAASEAVHAGGPVPPIAAYEPTAPIITVGSLSKLFWGGLRVGWVRAAAQTISRLARVKALTDLGTAIPSQLLAIKLLERTHEARAERRAMLADRYERLTSSLSRLLPSWSWSEPGGGGSLWVRLPSADAVTFTQIALRHGIEVSAGSIFSAHDHFEDHIRVPFVAPLTTLHVGVQRLARAWDEYTEDVGEVGDRDSRAPMI